MASHSRRNNYYPSKRDWRKSNQQLPDHQYGIHIFLNTLKWPQLGVETKHGKSVDSFAKKLNAAHPSSQAIDINVLSIKSLGKYFSQSLSSSRPSVSTSFCEVCYDIFHLNPKAATSYAGLMCKVSEESFKKWAYIIRQRRKRTICLNIFRENRFSYCGSRGSSFSDRNSRLSQTEKAPTPTLTRKS